MSRKRIATLFLIMGTFFNPLGFDVLFKSIMDLTGSYWLTTGVFYLLSLLCFGVYAFLSDFKPRDYIRNTRFFNKKNV